MLVLFDVTCIAFLLALILTPLVRRIATHFQVVDHPDSHRKLHGGAIPRCGGVSVVLAYAIALVFVWLAPYRNLTFDIPKGIQVLWNLTPAAAIIFAVGLVDDIRGLNPWLKLGGEVIAALVAYASGFGVHVFQGQPVSDWLSPLLTIVWLVGCTNALNLIDGMDGLAAGVGIFATLTSFVAGLIHNSLELALVTAPLVGALVGFLRYNFNPASIFLGDCGSLSIGFLLGCFATMWSMKSATVLGMTAPLIALAMPLLDTVLAILRRFLRGQPIFSADRGHIHHRLLDRGLTPRRVALLLYGICGVAAALSLLQDLGQNHFGGLIIILFCVAAWIGVQHLGYAEFGVAGSLVLRGTFRNLVNTKVRLQAFERALGEALTAQEAWTTIERAAREFGMSGIRMSIDYQIFESLRVDPEGSHWRITVPLPYGGFLELYCDPQQEIHSLIPVSFPRIVERFLRECSLAKPISSPDESKIVEVAGLSETSPVTSEASRG